MRRSQPCIFCARGIRKPPLLQVVDEFTEGNIMQAKILTVFNQKGGVGKSTICHNLAAIFGRSRKPKNLRVGEEDTNFHVLLIDNDSSGDLTKLCGFDQDDFQTTAADLYYHNGDTNFSPVSCIYESGLENVDIIPGNGKLTTAARQIDSLPGKELILKKELRSLRNMYDFIIIDCGPSFGTLSYSALVAADTVIVPVQTSHLAVEDTSAFEEVYKVIYEMGLNDNLTDENHLLVASLYNAQTKDDKEALKILQGSGCIAVIPQAIAARKGYKQGLPVVYTDPSCKVSRAFYDLAKKIIIHFWPDSIK